MFEDLNKYRKIIVTGCQRSGTTICAKIIANDLNIKYVDERDFNYYDYHSFMKEVDSESQAVIQAPTMFHECLNIDNDDVMIIIANRDLKDIKDSEKRIEYSDIHECRKLNVPLGTSCEYKQNIYKNKRPNNSMIVEYESLSAHPLWISQRENFKPKQTTWQ